ncbi:methyl-accepting chemotaxis protein [Acidovorax sp. SUPP2825]|uniref:methyl-accepting chemotaxis protein n=1 Tax=Acidovorax sp. SUPP2825 TaxID=2920879 RepID=UPI0023DE22F0|nr:methyl-accepting chemotaxis protein [Acidovorax sp. SUPP2825]GKS93516.1 methyl-accepting chemotaxis protein [Acidovorax sp. SUPP2825]
MFKSLRARLIGICVAITVLSLLALALVTFFVVRNDTLAQLDEHVGGLTRLHADEVAEWVREKQRITSSLKVATEQPDPLPMLRAIKQAGAFDLVYFTYADKRHMALTKVPDGYDGTSRPWYKQAAQAGGPVITPAYVGASSGKLTITFAEPAGPAGQPTAVVATDIYLDSVTAKVNAIHPIAKSFAFLLDGDSKILAYAKPGMALKPVSEISGSLDAALIKRLAERNERTDVQIDGAEQMLYAAKVQGTPWTLAIAIDRAEATQSVSALLKVAIVITLLSVVAAVALVTVAVSHQLRRLGVVRDALEDIASGDGDLTRRLSTHGSDELTQIASAFNHFVDKIAAVLVQIRASSESVRLATSEIASGNQDLSSRTEQQASSLEETAAAMEQLTATVQQNAENARQANTLATGASEIATHGGTVVGQVVKTMGGIDASARKIVDIIGVIDGIAFQTNILALNAAVEAARAGEQGRGFAVVASEVRTLAQRSATAAKEIKALIDDSVNQVDAGSKLVQDAGATMDKVVDSVRRVTAIVAEISNASQEQSTGIAEIGSAVSQMDQSTQQNAALVEEATAAAQSLQQQAAQLADAVAGFKLDAHGAATPSRGGPAAGTNRALTMR